MVELFTTNVSKFEFNDLSGDVFRGESGNDRSLFTEMYLNVIKATNIIKCGCKE